MIITKLCIHESYIRNVMSFKTPYLQRWRQDFFKKFTNYLRVFYWNFFSVSWLGVFHVKEHLWRHSCSFNDVTLCKNILSNVNFIVPQVSCKNYTLFKGVIISYSTPTFKGYPKNIELCTKHPPLHFCKKF